MTLQVCRVTGVQACDCKCIRLWALYPIDEMKYSPFGNEANRGGRYCNLKIKISYSIKQVGREY